jgi:hypothetical protein
LSSAIGVARKRMLGGFISSRIVSKSKTKFSPAAGERTFLVQELLLSLQAT